MARSVPVGSVSIWRAPMTTSAGTGHALATPGSFYPATDVPAYQMDATLDEWLLEAGPGTFPLSLSFGGAVPLPLSFGSLASVFVEAQVEVGASGKGLRTVTPAKLGGLATMDGIVVSINAYVDTSCGCLNMTEPLMYMASEGKAKCNKAPNSTCEPEGARDMLSKFCSVVSMLIKPDIDADGTGIEESISVGLLVGLESVDIVGVTAE